MRIPETLLRIGLLCTCIVFAAALVAMAQEKNSQEGFTRQDFDNAICFRKCHAPQSISPKDKPKNLWRMLIEKNGHAIFAEIPWQSQEQKEKILQYLLAHANNAEPEYEGIGVW
ncbi:MAG: hypothetical protein ACLFNS_05925 [Desulfobacterales bacterium]